MAPNVNEGSWALRCILQFHPGNSEAPGSHLHRHERVIWPKPHLVDFDRLVPFNVPVPTFVATPVTTQLH